MRLLLALLLCFMLGPSARAQLGIFPTDSVKWVVGVRCYDGNTSGDYSEYEYTINRIDSIIDGKSYFIIAYFNTIGIRAFLRVEGDKLYHKPYYEPEVPEVVVYDGSLEVGDTLVPPTTVRLVKKILQVESIDSIELLDGSIHKRVNFVPNRNSCGEILSWIEGVGSVPTPFYFERCFECEYEGFKFYHKGVLLWHNLVSTHEEKVPQARIIVRHGSVAIETDLRIEELSLYDLSGRHLRHATHTQRISLEGLDPAVYVLSVQFDDGSSKSYKFMKP